jgi:hypothetical protein
MTEGVPSLSRRANRYGPGDEPRDLLQHIPVFSVRPPLALITQEVTMATKKAAAKKPAKKAPAKKK